MMDEKRCERSAESSAREPLTLVALTVTGRVIAVVHHPTKTPKSVFVSAGVSFLSIVRMSSPQCVLSSFSVLCCLRACRFLAQR